MKPAAIWMIVIASLTVLWSIIDFASAVNDRHDAVQRLSIYSAASAVHDIERLDDQEREDGIAASFFLLVAIGSAGVLAHVKQQSTILDSLERIQSQTKAAAGAAVEAPCDKVVR